MAIKDSLLAELDHEVETTRSILRGVPDADSGWKPHPKSTAMGALAVHIVNMHSWAVTALRRTEVDYSTPDIGFTPAKYESTAKLVEHFDKVAGEARAAIAATTDEDMRVTFTLRNKDRVIVSMPRVAVLRSFIMNHVIHHRGQLSVYLRMRDVPLPPIYGPTADS